MVDPVISLGAALVLAWVLGSAAWHKFRAPDYFSATLVAYELLPRAIAPYLARLLPVIELSLAAALAWVVTRPVAGMAAASLFAIYALAIAINLARGRTAIDCGCGDPDQHQPLSAWLLLRNSALIGLALAGAAPVTARAMGWLDWLVAAFAAVTIGLIYAACNQLLSNRELLANLGSNHGHA